MTAFCVFGVTYDNCMKAVQKKLAPRVEEKGKPVRSMTPEEYRAAVKEEADKLFIKAGTKQISPAFDAPQFAHEWLELAKKSKARSLKVMHRGPKKDKKGEPVVKDGKPVITWLPYNG